MIQAKIATFCEKLGKEYGVVSLCVGSIYRSIEECDYDFPELKKMREEYAEVIRKLREDHAEWRHKEIREHLEYMKHKNEDLEKKIGTLAKEYRVKQETEFTRLREIKLARWEKRHDRREKRLNQRIIYRWHDDIEVGDFFENANKGNP